MIEGNAIDISNVTETAAAVPIKVVTELGQIGLWLQTLGILIVLWLIFQIFSLVINRRRMQEIYAIKKDMQRIERKIDKIVSKK